MRIYAPRITSGEARESESDAYTPIYVPKNKDVLDALSKDDRGNVKFGDEYLGTDAICVNVPGKLTENTTVRVVLPFDVGIPKGWAHSVGKAVTAPSAPKSIALFVDGAQKGTATIAVDGKVTFSGLDSDGVHVAAGTEIAFKLDSLVNSNVADLSLSIYVLK